jgi:REP element-mobilizing transposase RayT
MIKGKPLRLDMIFIDQPLYFITLRTLYRRPVLATKEVHENLRTYCIRAIDHNVAVGRYVIMPDHIHLFVRGSAEFELGIWVRGLKRAISRGTNFSQPGFFDHILRSDESYSEKWNYIFENPVRAGLVSHADEWPYQGEIVSIDCA